MRGLLVGTIALSIFTIIGCDSGKGTLDVSVEASGGNGFPQPQPQPQPGGNNNGNGGAKSLLSVWTESSGLFAIDLRTATFATQTTVPVSFAGQSCSCTALILGTEASGNMQVNSCSGSVAQCVNFTAVGTYTKTASTLSLCPTGAACYTLL